MAVSQDGSRVYVNNGSSSSVSVIDAASNSVRATVQVGSFPGGVAVTPDGSKVYVANTGSNSVCVIATASAAVIVTIPKGSMGLGPNGVVVSPDARFKVQEHRLFRPGRISR